MLAISATWLTSGRASNFFFHSSASSRVAVKVTACQVAVGILSKSTFSHFTESSEADCKCNKL